MKKGYLCLQVILYKADRASSKDGRVEVFRVGDVDENDALNVVAVLRTEGTQLRLGRGMRERRHGSRTSYFIVIQAVQNSRACVRQQEGERPFPIPNPQLTQC